MAPFRRLSLVLFAVIAAAGLSAAAAAPAPAPQPLLAPEVVMGNPKAKVTMIEYASASCPHCARMNNDVFPELKKKYIDTGKVRYVFREMLTPPQEFAGISFLIARCAGPAKYFAVLDDVFHEQAAIYESGDMAGGLLKIAAKYGLSRDQVEACTSDEKAITALNERIDAAEKAGIESTPTFVIGPTSIETTKPMVEFAGSATKIEGEKPLADLAAVLDPMLAK